MTELSISPYPGDEDLLSDAQARGRFGLSVYPFWETAVVLGRGSKIPLELHQRLCLKDSVPVYRRRGGGCAVVLDPGNVIVALTLRAPGFGNHQAHFNQITDWFTAGLAEVGFDGVRQGGISDLVLGDRKVGGACIYRSAEVLLYSASLLIRPETRLMARYLKHPPREPGYRAGRDHAAFVTSFSERAPGVSVSDFAAQLRAALGRSTPTLS